MYDIEFAKYSEIKENRNETNWLAHQLLMDVISTENIIQIFDV